MALPGLAARGQQHHHHHDGHRDHAVEHGRPEQLLDRIHRCEAQHHTAHCGRGDHAVEGAPFVLVQAQGQASLPAGGLGHCIGCRTRQHRHSQHPGADDAQTEQEEGEIASQGTQCLGGLRGGLDVGDAGSVQCGCCAQDDEEGDQVGECHAEDRVGLDAAQVLPHLLQRRCRRAARILYFLRRLPEEQVRTDRGAEHRHHGQQNFVSAGQLRAHHLAGYLPPVHTQREHHGHVGQQRQRQPLQPAHIGLIRNEHLQHHGQQAEGHGVHMD